MNLKKFIEYKFGEPSTIIEFGFYDGEDSIKYKRWFPHCKVLAIEADPINYDIHKEIMNKVGVQTFHYAITNFTGEIDFHIRLFTKETNGKPIGFHSPGCGTLPVTDYAIDQWSDFQDMTDRKVKVPAITMQEFCRINKIKNIDFMHIDVEGALKEVLEGFGSIRPKFILAETDLGDCYRNSNTKKEYDVMFTELGYESVHYKAPDTYYILKS